MPLFKYAFTLLIFLHALLAIAAPRFHPEAARLYDAGVRALTHGEQEKSANCFRESGRT